MSFEEKNQAAFDNPQPGDHWHERFIPCFLVLDCLEDGTFIICDQYKEVNNNLLSWEVEKAERVDRSYFNRVKYHSIEGFVADVSTVKHTGAVAKWEIFGRPVISLKQHQPYASDFRTVMEQGV